MNAQKGAKHTAASPDALCNVKALPIVWSSAPFGQWLDGLWDGGFADGGTPTSITISGLWGHFGASLVFSAQTAFGDPTKVWRVTTVNSYSDGHRNRGAI